MDIIKQIRYKAGIDGLKTIVLPESGDLRILKAAAYLTEKKMCEVILVGKEHEIRSQAVSESLELPSGIDFRTFENDPDKDLYTEHYYSKSSHKGITREKALHEAQKPLVYAASLVAHDRTDGCLAGAVFTTPEVLRAAIRVIGLKPGTDIVSSSFLMSSLEGQVFTYADCAVVPGPDAAQLADITIEAAITHEKLTGETPKVAMLSFSTKGSALHERSRLVTDALQLVRSKNPNLQVDGELQFDAAYVPEVAERKAPGSPVAGQANVFIFPNLDAGNIAYKITERLAGATAVGPILQGLASPMNDISRGCSWEDVVNMACITCLMKESQERKKEKI